MDIRKIVLVSGVLLLAIASLSNPALPAASSKKDSVEGRVQVADDDGNSTWIELQAEAKQDGKTAQGELQVLADGNNLETMVDLAYLAVEGDYAWLAGECTKDNGGQTGKWLFVAVHDGGQPGRLVDHLWLEWLGPGAAGETTAKQKVESRDKPAENKTIESGDIQVNDYAD